MPLLGQAALAMWWDLAAEHRAGFEDWHAHEHFPERLGIPGFNRGSRWARTDGGGQFVMYELAAYETLASPAYLARLNAPTPWSTQMMPLHQNMVRCQCRITESFGGGLAGYLATLRLSPSLGRADELRAALKSRLEVLPMQKGLTGAHLLIVETPDIAQTVEQKIRGGDKTADWIVLTSGYDAGALDAVMADTLSDAALIKAGAAAQALRTSHRLAFAMTAQDVRGTA